MSDPIRDPSQIRHFTREQLLCLAVLGDPGTRSLIDDELDRRAFSIPPSCPAPLQNVDSERTPLRKPFSTGLAAG